MKGKYKIHFKSEVTLTNFPLKKIFIKYLLAEYDSGSKSINLYFTFLLFIKMVSNSSEYDPIENGFVQTKRNFNKNKTRPGKEKSYDKILKKISQKKTNKENLFCK